MASPLSNMPFLGGLFGPTSGQEDLQNAFGSVQNSYMGMRPQMDQAYQNLLAQVHNQMMPAHQALANMYGQPPPNTPLTPGQNPDVLAATAAWNPNRPQLPPPAPGPGGNWLGIPWGSAVPQGYKPPEPGGDWFGLKWGSQLEHPHAKAKGK